MIKGIEHAGIAAGNPAALAAWYMEHLAMREIRSNGAGTCFLEAPDGFILEIYPAKQAGESGFDNYSSGLRHLAVLVEDFDAEYQCLCDKGIQIAAEPVINGDMKLVLFRDPEGNLCHLIERASPLKQGE